MMSKDLRIYHEGVIIIFSVTIKKKKQGSKNREGWGGKSRTEENFIFSFLFFNC